MTRSTLDTGICASLPDETKLPTCTGCGCEIDPTVCACGETIVANRVHDNHSPIPMGCNCYRERPA